MVRAYNICMIVGIAIPLVSLVLGGLFDLFDGLFEGLGEALDGLDLDLSVELGGWDLCLVPLSMQSLCAGALLFGTVGRLVYNGENLLGANIAAGVAAYLAAMAIQTLIHKLKKVEHAPLTRDQLQMCDAKVTNTIVKDGFGAISIRTEDGVSRSYPARSHDSEPIRQDTAVYVLRFEKNVAIVKQAHRAGGPLELL